MIEHLPILVVTTPLLAAPICVILRQKRWVYGLSLLTSWAVFAMAVAILSRVLSQGEWIYALGGWAAPWGLEYRIDVFSAFILLIVSANAAIVLPYSPRSVARELPDHKHYLYYAVFLLCETGLLGIVVTGPAG